MKAIYQLRAILFIPITAMFLLILAGCSEETGSELINDLENQVEKLVHATAGDTLVTESMLRLIIPSEALSEDGKVFMGITGDEPESVPNQQLEVLGKPFTLRLPALALQKPLQLTFPLELTQSEAEKMCIFLHNGRSYFPLAHTQADGRIQVEIDDIDWDSNQLKLSDPVSEFVILALRYKQTPTEEERGLRKIDLDGKGGLNYSLPTAGPDSRILLLVHGWLSNSSRWTDFMEKVEEQNRLDYDEYWTFSYNSAWSIDENAGLLLEALETHGKGAQIDILAHSMGGLVSRAMIEKLDGAELINRLITLGTPHKGSPLAVFRYYLGAIVSLENENNTKLFNYTSQGFRDLDPESEFIRELSSLSTPPVPYYTLACDNEAHSFYGKMTSQIYLSGPDDGIVEVSSAQGVPGAFIPSYNVKIDTDFAHLEIPDDDQVFEQVMAILK